MSIINYELILFRLIFMSGVISVGVISFCIFFDQAKLVRHGTIFRVATKKKRVALTFDDGPSPTWTPRILDALKESQIKATFFLIGYHVQRFPDVARRIAEEGHQIGNHGFAHSVLLYYTDEELEAEIKYTELVIKEITGQTTKIFRPPKAWIGVNKKRKIRSMGYEVILWSLSSKDWVGFNHKSMVRYICNHIENGDILLFHDCGGVFKAEGGDRTQTVLAVSLLAKKLKEQGFEFVTVEELMNS